MANDIKTLRSMYHAFLSAALGTVHPEKGETWEALGYHDSFTEDALSAA